MSLFRSCKKHGVTLNSALEAATLRAASFWIASHATQTTSEQLGNVSSFTNPHMRKHLPQQTFGRDESEMASHMWMVKSEYAITQLMDEDFWATARRVQTTFTATKDIALNSCPLFTHLRRFCLETFLNLRGRRIVTCNHTNRGESSWMNPQEGVTRVVGLLNLANHSFGSVFWWFVTTVDSRMFVSVSYATQAVSDDDARAHMQRSLDMLRGACA